MTFRSSSSIGIGTRLHTRMVRILVLFSVLLVAAACAATPAPTATAVPPTAAPDYTFGLAVSNLANPFFAELQTGAEDAAELLGITIIAVDAGDDADTQTTQIDDLIAQGIQALLINPVDSTAIVSAVEAANAAGIPVFTIDRSADGGDVVAHIASDNLAGGRMAGEFLADAINETGNVVELMGIEGTSAAQQRGAGFNEAMAAYPDITIVAAEVANFSRAEGETVFAQILDANEEIDAVFAHNDEMILGAIEAARAADRLGDIVFVGFDAVEDAIASLEAGELLATIAQQPAEMGRLGVETALKSLNGETIDSDIPVDLALITR
jgi:ribose transport system substrate-binding protein